MKKIIVLVCLVILYVYLNYPVFDNLGISYFIIFICLVVLCFAGAKLYTSGISEDYNSVEKENDRLYNFDGIFRYSATGFSINQNNTSEFVEWNNIISVNSIIIPVVYTTRTNGVEIITEKKVYEFDEESSPGFEKFVNELYNNLPIYDDDSVEIVIDNHRVKRKNIYRKITV